MKHLALDIGIHPGCGGTIRISDGGRRASRGFRYEAYCSKCLQCDPNGYGNRGELMIEAAKYFRIKPKEAKDGRSSPSPAHSGK